MRRDRGIPGKKQQLPAEHICTVHAMKRQDLAQNIQIMTESLIRGIKNIWRHDWYYSDAYRTIVI